MKHFDVFHIWFSYKNIHIKQFLVWLPNLSVGFLFFSLIVIKDKNCIKGYLYDIFNQSLNEGNYSPFSYKTCIKWPLSWKSKTVYVICIKWPLSILSLVYFSTRVPDTSDTNDMIATRLRQERHECYTNDTSATRVLRERHKYDTSEKFWYW